MFYEHIILAKKGPLARVWLAAHWDKKITKAHVFETNIEKSVEGILQPKVKLALRTSGHLLLGVVRIYSRKAKYLLADCNEAFVKIKMAFRPGMVDLPEGHREANVNAITLPEVFHDFDTALPELNDIDIEAQFSINQSRADEITMREDYGSLSISMHDDGFGDVGFEGDTPEIVRGSLESNIHDNFVAGSEKTNVNEESTLITLNEADFSNSRLEDDGFGDEFGQPELFEGDLFGEPQQLVSGVMKEKLNTLPDGESEAEDLNEHFNDQPLSPASSNQETDLNEQPRMQNRTSDEGNENNEVNDNKILDQSTLIQNEDESFALAPVDASAFKGITKAKRKRKLIVDETKNISGEEMKAQLANTSDIVTTLDLAPPTKRWLMFWKETGGVEKLFSLPSRSITARALFLNYQRHLISHFAQLEDFSCLGTAELLCLDHIQNENESPLLMYSKRGRKRKMEQQAACYSNMVDTNLQILAAPEGIRQQNNVTALSGVSLEIMNDQESVAQESTFFENVLRSPTLRPLNSLTLENNQNSLNDVSFTPTRTQQGADSADDFQHSDLSPTGFNHGHFSPHNSGIENIDSIPNLLPEHASSLVHESDNIDDISLVQSKTCQISSDWNDFEFPSTLVAQTTGDEQMENETDEQFEERVLNKRAAQMFYAVKSRMMTNEFLLLSQLTIKNSRKQAAQKFYSLLVLKKFRALNISQSKAYEDIFIERGPLFENPKL